MVGVYVCTHVYVCTCVYDAWIYVHVYMMCVLYIVILVLSPCTSRTTSTTTSGGVLSTPYLSGPTPLSSSPPTFSPQATARSFIGVPSTSAAGLDAFTTKRQKCRWIYPSLPPPPPLPPTAAAACVIFLSLQLVSQ